MLKGNKGATHSSDTFVVCRSIGNSTHAGSMGLWQYFVSCFVRVVEALLVAGGEHTMTRGD
jgi:hypothetical protein